MRGSFYVSEWLVEPDQSRIVRGSERARLDPKAIQVLSFLAEHPDEVLTKERIIAKVWEGTFVSDEVLTTAVWGLRKALGDDAKEPRYIKTIARQGYRLIASVERAGGEPAGAWEPSPYPGLASFSQRDARYFHGREEEIEALWTKLQENRFLGVIGASGAGGQLTRLTQLNGAASTTAGTSQFSLDSRLRRSTDLPGSTAITRDVVVLDDINEVDRALVHAEDDPVAAADAGLEVVLIRQDRLHVQSGGVEPLEQGQDHSVA